MTPFITLVLAWAAGTGLGLFYFGGLWLTIQQLPFSGGPALLLVGSFVGRTALTLVGFYLVMGGRWERMLACLVGFMMARLFLVSRLRPERVPAIPRGREGV
jgi:F1F0 ATPase subunit 2